MKNVMKKIGKFFNRTIIVSLLLVITVGLGLSVFVINGASKAEIPEEPSALKQQNPIEIYASDGKTLISKIQPEGGVRTVVESNRISSHMKDALVSAEDRTFWDNPGVSFKGIASAALKHIKKDPTAGGGSTVTQQLVKNTLVGDEYSMDRKVKEALSSMKLTASWTKEDIITAYLNTIYFGRGSLGIEEASQSYFGVHAAELNPSQSALIAGIIQAPSEYDPINNRKNAEYRFNYVKDEMKQNGYLTQKQYDDMKFPEVKKTYDNNKSTGLTDSNGHIVSSTLQELALKGYDKKSLHAIGAKITTTIDPKVQKSVTDKSRAAAQFNGIRVATAAINPKTGGIAGIYGGDDGLGYDLSKNPQMTGSTFKVFALAAALENGIGLDTEIDSSPYTYNGVTVDNSDGMTCGKCSLAEATKQSLNTSFYRLQDMLPNGPETTREMAHNMGVDAPLSEKDGSVNKALVLGAYGTSPIQLATGFSTIANNGIRNDRHIVDKVMTQNGQLEYKNNSHPTRVLSDHTAQDIDKALEPIAAYSNNNQLSGKTGYVKTGTVALGDSGQNRDALAAGYTDNLALGIWMGALEDGAPVTDANGGMMWGAGAPTTLWRDILNEVG